MLPYKIGELSLPEENIVLFSCMIPSVDIPDYIYEQQFQNYDVPLGVSWPVLREEYGKIFVASFVTFFRKDHFKNRLFERPTAWVIADVDTGKVAEIFHIDHYDFSNAEWGDPVYDLDYKGIVKGRKEYYSRLFEMLDEVRTGIINGEELDYRKYQEYLRMLTMQQAPSYRRFARELSNI